MTSPLIQMTAREPVKPMVPGGIPVQLIDPPNGTSTSAKPGEPPAAFVDRPKHLDPVQSYTEDEARFTQQVYEPLLQYHYLKRPYELVPLTAVEVPRPKT